MIVDDMPLAVQALKIELEEHFSDRIEIVDLASGVMEAAKKISSLPLDLIFLDIHMSDGDGFDLLDIINRERMDVIFTTGSRKHALKAFEYAAVDYLLKPIDQEQLQRALSKLNAAAKTSNSEGKGLLSLSTQDTIRIVAFKNIIRIEAEGNYSRIYISDGSQEFMSKTLKFYEEKLDDKFLRVHQSHLINILHVKAYKKTEGGYLIMNDGTEVPVSVRKKALVKDWLASQI